MNEAEEQVRAAKLAVDEAKGQKQTHELDLARAKEQVTAKRETLEEAEEQVDEKKLVVKELENQVTAKEKSLEDAKNQLNNTEQTLDEANKKVTLLKRLNTLSEKLRAQPDDYRDKKSRYVHFLDGGIADNMGLTPLLGLLDHIICPIVNRLDSPKTNDSACYNELDQNSPSRIVVIVVNAHSNPENDYGKYYTPPGIIDTVSTAIGVGINSTSFSLFKELELIQETIPKRLESKIKMSIVNVSFSGIKDDDCRRWFQNIDTNWSLDLKKEIKQKNKKEFKKEKEKEKEIKALIDIGDALVSESPKYKEFIEAFKYEQPQRQVKTVSKVCENIQMND